ncbi:MAG: hypothetical protein MUC76_06995 [Spirochaetes bacterium]|nr:hypothetical protein [Spirochaetota bacterium]
MVPLTKKHVAVLAVFIVMALVVLSVETPSRADRDYPCDRAGNTVLPALLKKGSIGELTWWGGVHMGSGICDWSSSHLRATGSPPARAVPAEGQDEDEADYEYYRALERWSCMYTALSAMDGSTATAWCEGKKDEGIGEILIVKVDTAKPVRIWNGLGAGDSLYRANNRAQKIRVWALQARQARKEIGQYETGLVFTDITVVGSHEITLKDFNGWQSLPLPPRKRLAFQSVIEKGEPAVKYEDSMFLAIEILSVYRGAKYNDTCISEIGNGEAK